MRNRVAVIGLIACGAWSVPAAGQYGLGGGDALDANTGSAYGGRNLPAAMHNFRDRNLLVTGNVVGGRGFRGTVGYTAEYDFRGELGSNDLFFERANAAFSGPRVLTAGRSLERLRFGQYLGAVEYRRAGTGSSPRRLNEQRFVPQPMIDDRINLDHFAISSTTSAIYEAKRDGRMVGLLQGGEDQDRQLLVASASSVFGVQLIPQRGYGQFIGLTRYDMVRALEDAEAGVASRRIGEAFDQGFTNLRQSDLRIDAQPLTTRVEPEVAEPLPDTPYLDVLERISQRYADEQPEEPEGGQRVFVTLDEQFALLRERMAETAGPGTGEAAGSGIEAPEPGSGTDRPTLSLDIEKLAGPLRHGAWIDHLTVEDRDRFQELLASGEQMLRDGEYFWAERRFERALRFIPGHPLATAGLGHAQIGAGVYAPAALTLRRLLTQRPEMIDTRYAPELLPNRVRLDIAVDAVRQRLTEQRDRGLHAFLLAYIGHQLDKRELVEEGLEIMGEASPDDPLPALLETVWLPQVE